MIKKCVALCFILPLAAVPIALSGQATVVANVEAKVDAVFAKWSSSTPGCAVGVATGGKPALAKGYGMADLEHDVANTRRRRSSKPARSPSSSPRRPCCCSRGRASCRSTIRSGSTFPSCPTTATAARRSGTCSTHTSGLRDWGSVAGIAGWPRGTRAYTHAHVLDIVSRQRAPNFTPGTHYSYSNTGYNLARHHRGARQRHAVRGVLATRLFQPLGMTHTSWRDDYTRIVKGRAMAYTSKADGFRSSMPFENVHGNGGLLTTVGDLLKWNENFVVAGGRGRGVRGGTAEARNVQRRPHARVCPRAVRRRPIRASARCITAAPLRAIGRF